MNFFSNNKIDNNMSIILEFILSICIFIYGIQLFSKGISNLLNVTTRTITRLIKELLESKLIRIEYSDEGIRKIYIIE